jgi:Flp pilus assembly pilin Flp
MLSRVRCFTIDGGQTTPEYAIVLTIITLAAAGLFIAFAGGIQGALTTVSGLL